MIKVQTPGPGPSIQGPRGYPGNQGPIPTRSTDLGAPSWTGKSTLSGDPAPERPAAIAGVPFAATATSNGQTRAVDLGFVGYSLPDGTADSYDGRTGELAQRVGKIVLDGTEEWHIGAAGIQTNTITLAMRIGPIANRYAISTHFVSIWLDQDTPHFYTSAEDGGWISLFIPLSLLSAPTVEAAKAWLTAQKAAGTPVTVLYALAIPLRTTRKADLQCFDGETTITGADRVEIMDGRVERFGGYLPYQCARSNRNLLVNWDFRAASNQRGQGSYTADGLCIDLWHLYTTNGGAKSLRVGDGCIELTSPTGGHAYMDESITRDLTAGPYTMSLAAEDGVYGELWQDAGDNWTCIAITLTNSTVWLPGGAHRYFFRVVAPFGKSAKIYAAKFEAGGESTLWVDLLQPPDPAEQLRRCQRYFVRLPFMDKETIGNACYGATWLNLQLALPTEMAVVIPTATITCAPTRVVDGVTLPALGNVRVRGTNCNLGFQMQGTAGASYLFAGQAGYIDLSCEP